ncbi:hypothetical protein Peur_013077 [Populus x canadensis]
MRVVYGGWAWGDRSNPVVAIASFSARGTSLLLALCLQSQHGFLVVAIQSLNLGWDSHLGGPAKFLLTQLNFAIDEVSAQLHPEDAASGIAVASDEIQASIQEISVEISMQASIIAQNILFSIGLFL